MELLYLLFPPTFSSQQNLILPLPLLLLPFFPPPASEFCKKYGQILFLGGHVPLSFLDDLSLFFSSLIDRQKMIGPSFFFPPLLAESRPSEFEVPTYPLFEPVSKFSSPLSSGTLACTTQFHLSFFLVIPSRRMGLVPPPRTRLSFRDILWLMFFPPSPPF